MASGVKHKMLKQILFLLGQDWKRLPLLFLLNVFLAILELFSLGLLIPLLGEDLRVAQIYFRCRLQSRQ